MLLMTNDNCYIQLVECHAAHTCLSEVQSRQSNEDLYEKIEQHRYLPLYCSTQTFVCVTLPTFGMLTSNW